MMLEARIEQVAAALRRIKQGKNMFQRYRTFGRKTARISVAELTEAGRALRADVDLLNDAIDRLTVRKTPLEP